MGRTTSHEITGSVLTLYRCNLCSCGCESPIYIISVSVDVQYLIVVELGFTEHMRVTSKTMKFSIS